MPDTFTYINDDGKEIKYKVLLTFQDEETKKSYCVYTDNQKNENDETMIYFAGYDPLSPVFKLIEIEDEEEYKKLSVVVKELQKQISD